MRDKFVKRVVLLRSQTQIDTLLALLPNLPLDAEKPLQVTIEEYRPARKLTQQAAMWTGPLADIAEQAYVEGRRYSAEVWAEYYKGLYLPNEFDPELCQDGFVKYAFGIDGKPVLIGSTTQLTLRGMALYMQQLEADGAQRGVFFHAPPTKG